MRKLLHRAYLVEHLVAGGAAQFLAKQFDNRQWRNTRAHRDGHELRPAPQKGRSHLRKRVVQLCAYLSLIVAGKSPVTHMAYDADDFVRSRAIHEGFVIWLNARHIWNPKAFPEGIFSAEGALRQDVVHHNHKFVSQAVV